MKRIFLDLWNLLIGKCSKVNVVICNESLKGGKKMLWSESTILYTVTLINFSLNNEIAIELSKDLEKACP